MNFRAHFRIIGRLIVYNNILELKLKSELVEGRGPMEHLAQSFHFIDGKIDSGANLPMAIQPNSTADMKWGHRSLDL